MATLVQEMRVQLARLEVTSTRQGEQLKTTMGQVAATVSVSVRRLTACSTRTVIRVVASIGIQQNRTTFGRPGIIWNLGGGY